MRLVKRLLYSKYSSLVISMLLGVSLISFIFACSGDNCKNDYVGPNIVDIDKTFRSQDKCMKYKSRSATCDNSKKHVKFAY